MKNESKNKVKKPRSLAKKILRFFAFTFLSIFSVLLIITILLAFPPVQTFIAQKAAAYFSEKMGVTVTIDRVAISLISRKVHFKELMVLDHHQDTLLRAEKLSTGVDLLNLSETNIVLGETKLEGALFRLHHYKGEQGMNLDFILRKFKKDKIDTTASKPFNFKIRKIVLDDVQFNLIDDAAIPLPASFQPGNIRTQISSGDVIDFRIAKDSIIFKVRELQAMDRSGSGMSHFETDFVICSTAMFFENTLLESVDGSFVRGDIRFRYSNWKSFSNFIDSVAFDSDVKESTIFLRDVAYYTDALKGVPITAKFKGKVTGPVSAFKGRDLELAFGEDSKIAMNAEVYGLPNIDSMFFDVKMKGLYVTAKDIAHLKLYEDGTGLLLPPELYRMGRIGYVGRLTGNTWDFVTQGTLASDVGIVKTDLRLAGEPGFKHPIYSGTVKTNSFDPGKLLNMSNILGPISGELSIEGKEFNPKIMKATAKGSFTTLTLYGYPYQNVDVNGTFEKMAFDGKVNVNDPNIGLDFIGKTDFSQKVPQFNFDASLAHADLQKLGFWKDTLIIHKVNLNMDLAAKSVDEIKGVLYADSLSFTADTNKHYVQRISIQADSLGSERRLVVNSSILDMDMTGDFTLIPLMNNLMYNADTYFPSLKLKYDTALAHTAQTFHFNMALKNMKPVFDIVLPALVVAPNTNVSGRYFSDIRNAELELESDYIRYGKMRVADPELNLNTSSGDVELDLAVSRFNVSDSLWFDYINIQTTANNDSIQVGVKWTADVYNISSGNINFRTWMGNPGKYDLYFYNTNLILKEKNWKLAEKAFVGYSKDQLLVKDFDLTSDFGGQLKVSGVGTKSADDKLNIKMTNFPVAYLRTFGENLPELGGSLSGQGDIIRLFDKPFIAADLRIDTLSMYGQTLGDFIFTSGYNNFDQSLVLNGTLKTEVGNSLELKNGKIFPMRKGDNMDLTLTFQRFNVKPAEVFSAPVITNLKGYLTGKVHIGGSFSSPELMGDAIVEDGHVDIPYIGASYNLKFKPTKRVSITRTQIDFGEIQLEDNNYQTATLKGYIRHKDFKNLELYANITGKNFMFFNATKEQSPSFYGTAIATGTAEIKGPFEMLDIYAGMRTDKGTRLFIPMSSGPSQASQNSFVYFYDGRDTTKKDIVREKKAVGGIQLFIEAEVNENAEVQIIFDEYTGDVIKSIGKGNLRIELNRLGDLTMFGDYEIIKGDYLFTLKNLINKKLKLQQGGTIYWSGDPTKARIDASALYTVRTSPAPLFPEELSSSAGGTTGAYDNLKTRIPVNVLVNLDGELLEPQITFDIEFPTVDESTRNKLQQALSTEDEKNKQAFALLVLRQFLTRSGTGGDAVNIAGGNSLEVLSNQLSNWVSQISESFDVRVNYRPGDKTNTGQDQVEVALSTQILNNRVSIDANVGGPTSKGTTTGTTSNANGSMLDLTVEVKITDDGKFRIRGFNRSNDANIIRPFPYTQGVGVSYQTSFDTWKELFTSKKKRAEMDTLGTNNKIIPPPNEGDKAAPPVQGIPPDSLPDKNLKGQPVKREDDN